jgi:low affinity Fe/Cu permease
MKKKPRMGGSVFDRFAHAVSHAAGSTWGFIGALAVVAVWLLSGPVFGFSDTWQLVINTGTTIVTFLMVFLIQRFQNKESLAVQLKLDEIVAALPKASDRLIDAEDFDEEELEQLHKHYRRLAELAARYRSVKESHSLEEAEKRAELKAVKRRAQRRRTSAP